MSEHAPSVVVTLREGSRVTMRPIRASDKALLRGGFDRLSPESRHRRFLTPMPRLSDRVVRYLTEVDHHDHEALIALGKGGEGLGIARYIRDHDDPEAAEAAVTVVDDWQGRGLGTALLALLADRARQEGVRRFTALLLAENREMLELMAELGHVRVVDRAAGTIEVAVTLPQQGIGEHLHDLLRSSAAGALSQRPKSPRWSSRQRAR